MTDDQFDEICRGALAFDPGTASPSTWSKIKPAKSSWLPTIPEIFACGCAWGLVLLVLAARFVHTNPADEPSPVMRQAMGDSFKNYQASAVELADTTPWTQVSLSFPSTSWGMTSDRR